MTTAAPPGGGSALADVGIVGLGVMGANLARNFRSRGFKVAVHNRRPHVLAEFMARHGDPGYVACADLAGLAASLKSPRRIVLMVTAGPAVDQVLDDLAPYIAPDDIVVDGGNSHFPDTERRSQRKDMRFIGMGISGGEEGALNGPAMMPGGDRGAWEELRPMLEAAAAVSDSGPCVTWCGRRGAGHFVKMVHNGIEYGDMQLIAETHTLLRDGLGLEPAATRDVFESWNHGRLSSYLIEITAQIVAAKDPDRRPDAGPLVDAILDVAGQKGTGRWTAISAIEAGTPLSTITTAVDCRAMSSWKSERVQTASRFVDSGAVGAGDGLNLSVEDLEQALYAAKIMSYTQGFALLAQASEERGYGTNLAAVARIWKAGCIIRAEFLDRVYAAFDHDPDLPLLLLADSFADEIAAALPTWRKVVSAAALAGLATPALSASLAWFDGLRTARGSASLIQAQRDLFGAHTYRRVGAEDVAVHTDWGGLEQL